MNSDAQDRRVDVDVDVQHDSGRFGDRTSVEVDVEVLTRGPVHEAFAEPAPLEAEVGVLAAKEPPPPLPEEPPDEVPEFDGEEAEWIPGYWSWDEERQDYIWVSGTWRRAPPDRTWVPSYWSNTENGYQAASGFWLAEDEDEIEYLPQPPEPLEINTVGEPPSPDHTWVAGTWYWEDSYDWPHGDDFVYDRGGGFELRLSFGRERRHGYVWRPGYWMRVRPDWVWVTAHYVWTPRGYVFIDGYWDYPIERRGLLFAPVYFERPIHVARREYRYTPSIVIDVDVLTEHLFVGPRHRHYFFGDYYDVAYERRGILPWFEVYRRSHDPLFAHYRWRHYRDNPRWFDTLRSNYDHRVRHVDARPPRTYRVQQTRIERTTVADRRTLAVARPLREFTSGDRPFRTRRLDADRRSVLSNRWKDVQNYRERRAQWESGGRMVRSGGDERALRRDDDVQVRDNRSRDERVQRDDRIQREERVLTDRDARERPRDADEQRRREITRDRDTRDDDRLRAREEVRRGDEAQRSRTTTPDERAAEPRDSRPQELRERAAQRIQIERSPLSRPRGEARTRAAPPPRNEMPEPRKLRPNQRGRVQGQTEPRETPGEVRREIRREDRTPAGQPRGPGKPVQREVKPEEDKPKQKGKKEDDD